MLICIIDISLLYLFSCSPFYITTVWAEKRLIGSAYPVIMCHISFYIQKNGTVHLSCILSHDVSYPLLLRIQHFTGGLHDSCFSLKLLLMSYDALAGRFSLYLKRRQATFFKIQKASFEVSDKSSRSDEISSLAPFFPTCLLIRYQKGHNGTKPSKM